MSTETLLFKATVTNVDTEQGTFSAVISTSAIDREGDVVEPQAVVDALGKWVPLAKKVPLSWNHSVEDGDIIGHIEPSSATVKGSEVHVDGMVDRSIPRGEGAWRLVKSGTLGFSYGYIPLEAKPRKGAGRHITALDIYEITATPAPMNADTRVTGWKALPAPDEFAALPADERAALVGIAKQIIELHSADETVKAPPARTVDPLRKASDELALGVAMNHVSAASPQRSERRPDDDIRTRSRDLIVQLLSD
jgi:hypothetical protein